MALAENPELERAVLLEPDERIISQLRVRFANRAPVVLRAEVASSAAGYRTFYVAQDCTIGSCVPPAEGRTDVLAAREVKAVTIDDLLGDLGLDNVDFLKVDTEGHDFDVVLGAARQLSQRRLGVIQFEYGADYVRAGRTLTCFRRMLAGYGYKVFLLGPRGLRDVDHDLLGEHFSYSNYVALRADFVDLLGPSIERSRV
jgi:FkbM family methyltransferase